MKSSHARASSQSPDRLFGFHSAGSSCHFSGADLCKRDGSAVYVHSTTNQKRKAQETLRSISQPEYDFSKAEVKVEWEISNFVWWSEFLEKLPKAYLKLLDLLGIEKEDYYAEYNGFYNYQHTTQNSNCPVESIFVPIVNCGRYHPYASVKHKRRASVRALDRLEFLQGECRKRHVKFDYLIEIGLTLPKQISKLWYSEKVDRCIHKAVQDFLRGLHTALFSKHNSQFGAISNHHYWATRSPLEPHRHIHLTIPNVTYNSKTDMFHRFRPYIEESLIKEVWHRALKKNGLWVEVPDHVKPDCYIGYVKFEDKNRVNHRLSYCCRKPIEDMVGFLELSNVTGDFDKEFALFLLDYTPRRINLGFLTNLKRFGYSRKPSPMKCPICGCDMEPEYNRVGDKRLYPRPPPDILHLFRDRKGDWRETINLVRRW